jgi:hypothetical protein
MFKVNEIVRVVKCDGCPGVVGKTGRIKSLSDDGAAVSISFGKGRPQRGRPELFPTGDLALVTKEVEVSNG